MRQPRHSPEESGPNLVAPGSEGIWSNPWVRQIVVAVLPGLLAGALGVYVAIQTIETDVTALGKRADRNELRMEGQDERLAAHDASLGSLRAEAQRARERIESLEQYQKEQLERVHKFWTDRWPRVESALASVVALQRELDTLSRSLQRRRR